MDALRHVLPKLRAALGKPDLLIARVSDVQEEGAEKGALRIRLRATLTSVDDGGRTERDVEVELYQHASTPPIPSTVVLKKVTTLDTRGGPHPAVAPDLAGGDSNPEAGSDPTPEPMDDTAPATPREQAPPTSSLDAESCRQSPCHKPVSLSPAMLALLAATTVRPTPRAPQPRPTPKPLSPAVLALLRPLPKAVPDMTLTSSSSSATLSSSISPPSPHPTAAEAGFIPAPWLTALCRRFGAILSRVTPMPSQIPATWDTDCDGPPPEKRRRLDCGLEADVARRLRVDPLRASPLVAEAVLETPLGSVTCSRLNDILLATLSALDRSVPIGVRHRRCAAWVARTRTHHVFDPGHLLAPGKALSLREQLMQQRGCVPREPTGPDPPASPPRPSTPPPLDLGDSFAAMEGTPPRVPPPTRETPTPTLSATSSPKQSPQRKEGFKSPPKRFSAGPPPTTWSNPKYRSQPKVSTPSTPPTQAATTKALSADQRTQMKSLLERKLAVLQASFKKLKERSTDLLKDPSATPAQRQEVFKKLKETTDAIKLTIEHQKQVSRPTTPGARRIPGLTPLESAPSLIPSGSSSSSSSSSSAATPELAVTSKPASVSEELRRMVKEAHATWDLDEDVLFK